MADIKNRRQLKSRDTGWAQAITRRLAETEITPNQISIASVGFAALAGLCFAATALTDGALGFFLLLAGALFVQVRLLCNLFDGMVAVEAGKGDATGSFWNEVPDRPADIFILVGFGIGAGIAWLGWAAAVLAVLIAYLRAFAGSLGQEASYSGPMAKQHRMAAVTVAAVGAVFLSAFIDAALILKFALWLIVLGELVTVLRRSSEILAALSQET